MKKHMATTLIIAASLLMALAAWLLKNGLPASRTVRAETRAQVPAAGAWLAPVEGAAVEEPYGAAYDEALGQWSLRQRAALRCERGALVRAMKDGRVAESHEEDGAWVVSLDHGEDGVVRYGGLRAGLAVGRRVAQGELLGRLAGDTLLLGWQADGLWRDPAEILPDEPLEKAGFLPPGVEVNEDIRHFFTEGN